MTAASSATPTLPLFYAEPVPLAAARHGAWRLRPGNADFARHATSIPLVFGDFAPTSRSYPIVFTAGEPAAVALVGLDRVNLFVDEGRWADRTYVPAYVRRYPFLMIEAADKSGFALAADAASDLIGPGSDGEPLFDGDQPSPATLRALEFCRLFTQDHERAKAFCRALAHEDLLVDRQANIALPTGRKLAVAGFQVVDPERFAALPEDKVVAWHRDGTLALIHFHLASLERFQDLMLRQSRCDLAQGPSGPDTQPTTLP
jgi:hypothetical protein